MSIVKQTKVTERILIPICRAKQWPRLKLTATYITTPTARTVKASGSVAHAQSASKRSGYWCDMLKACTWTSRASRASTASWRSAGEIPPTTLMWPAAQPRTNDRLAEQIWRSWFCSLLAMCVCSQQTYSDLLDFHFGGLYYCQSFYT